MNQKKNQLMPKIIGFSLRLFENHALTKGTLGERAMNSYSVNHLFVQCVFASIIKQYHEKEHPLHTLTE